MGRGRGRELAGPAPQEPRPPLQLPSGCGHSGDLGRLAGRRACSPEGARTALGWVPGGAHPPGGLAPRPLAWGLCPAPRTGSSDESVCLKCSPCIFPGTQRRGFPGRWGRGGAPLAPGSQEDSPTFPCRPQGNSELLGEQPQVSLYRTPGAGAGLAWTAGRGPLAAGSDARRLRESRPPAGRAPGPGAHPHRSRQRPVGLDPESVPSPGVLEN